MNAKKTILMFLALMLVLAIAFTSCGPTAPDDTTSESDSASDSGSPGTAPTLEGLEHMTDENGENVTLITYDDEGREIINDVFVPIGENTTVSSDNQGGDQTQTPIVTGQPSDRDASLSAIDAIAAAFSSGRFHLVSNMGDGETTDLMVYDGNMRIDMPFEDSVLAVLVLDDDFHLLNPEKKTYTSLNRAMMSMFGLNLDDLDISDKLMDSFVKVFQASGNPELSTVSLDGQAVTLYTYNNSDGDLVNVYLNGNSPVKIESYKADGSSSLNMTIESFNPNIRAEDVNVLSSYTKKSISSFITDMM